MKRTLHIMSLSRRAGLEVMFLNYLKYMKETNPEYIDHQYILVINISDYFKRELNKIGVRVYESKKRNKLDRSPIKLGRKIIKENNIDILYGQNFIGNTIASILSLNNRKLKVVCHEHGTSWSVKGVTSFLTFFWVNKADVIICNSKAAAILMRKRFKVNEDKLKVIYNGVNKGTKENLEKSKKELLFVGRLDVVKSPHTLLYMMSDLVKRDDEIVLEILKEGPYEDELKKMTRDLNLSSNVTFRGNVENVNEYMAKATLLILPSIREALGNVIIEAAFQETPTIATRVDGIPEVIKNGETGILITPKDKIYNHPPVQQVVNIETEQLQKPLSPSVESIVNSEIGRPSCREIE